ncbi:MAG: universal stress protein [Desulfobacterales bacterium]|nr:universal stress protein [Desulfobacterales bacterium]
MVEINRILFCHDFSDTADFVFPYAILMAEKFSAALYIIHVIEETLYHAPYFVMTRIEKISLPGLVGGWLILPQWLS